MSKGGGGGGSTTTVQKADPWVGLQGPLSSLYSNAQKWYEGGGPQYYPGATNAPSNPNIDSALGHGSAVASAGPSPYMQNATAGLNYTMQGRNPYDNPGFGTYQQFSNGSMMGQNPAQGYFQGATNGNFLDHQNPYLSSMVDSASRPVVDNFQRAIAPGIASQFSLAGRTGSGAHQAAFDNASSTLGRQLGDISTGIYGNAYESERNRQQQAAGQLSGMNFQDQANRMKGAEDIGQQYSAERALGQQASLMAPQFDAAKYNDLDKMLGIGEYQRGLQQQQMDADRQRYDFGQNQPLMNLQALNQLLQGGSAYASQTSKGSNSMNRNPFNSGIGGAFMANGLGSMMGGDAGAMLGGPMGMLGGALLGGLFG